MPSSEFNAANYYKRLVEDRQLTGIRCNVCGQLSPEARPMCAVCRSSDVAWHAFSGRATLSTFTCISVVPDYWGQKGYGRNNPYCSGIVTLEEGPAHQRPHHRRGRLQPAVHSHRHSAGTGPGRPGPGTSLAGLPARCRFGIRNPLPLKGEG